MSNKRLVIIDGNAIIHRAYHALPPLTTKTGEPINAVYGFTSMLIKVFSVLKPTHIVVSFDMAGGTFRHEKYAEYKATRVKADQELYDQIPLVHKVVEAFEIPIYEKAGYEADDVIGTIVAKNKKDKDLEIFIVTGDKDTFQLIEKNVKVFTLRKGMSDTVIYDMEAFKEKFEFSPKQMIDFKALRGDPSDNIPGVPGVGEKTATELLKNFSTVEKLYEAIKEKDIEKKYKILTPSVLKKLREGKKSAEISYDLATIRQDVPNLKFSLKTAEKKEVNKEKIVPLFQKLEFYSLLKRVISDGSEKNVTEKTLVKNTKNKKEKFIFSEIKTEKEVKEVFKKISVTKVYSAKAVFEGVDIFNGKFFGIILVVENFGYFVPENLSMPWFENKDFKLVGYDLKKLIKLLKIYKGLEIKNSLFDIFLASYLLNPGSRANDASSIVLKILGENLREEKGQVGLFGVDHKVLAEDLSLIFATREKLNNDLKEANNLDLLEKIEMPLSRVLSQMEMNGIAVDTPYLKEISERLKTRVGKITKEIYKLSGEEFNISSPIQLRDILFEKLEIPTTGLKKGKTGLSTAASELEKMHDLHPIIPLIEEYRELTKLQNTYVDVLPGLVNKKTGRIHTTFNQATTATGRLSSSDPNLQNIPIRTEIGRELREVFIAEKGNILLSADYSQIELRIVASLAEDKKMIDIFKEEKDIHQATAAIINGVSMDKVSKEMRRAAKEVNFGVLYGMGAFGLASRTGLSQYEAQDFIKRYFSQFSGVKKYLDETLSFAKKTGYVETLFGRRRYIMELKSNNWQVRANGERMAINHPVQGTAADLMKMAMIEVFEKLKKYGDKVKMLLQVHDELVIEISEKLVPEVEKIVKEAMEGVVKLRVPIKVETHVGKNWGK